MEKKRLSNLQRLSGLCVYGEEVSGSKITTFLGILCFSLVLCVQYYIQFQSHSVFIFLG
jgi:hypothetical protein